MLGNILIVLTALCLFGLINITSVPAPGGDRGVGYAFVMLFFGGGFLVLSGLLTWNMGARDCFDWVQIPGFHRGLFVFLAWLMFTIAVFAMAVFRSEWHPGELPEYLRWLSKTLAVVWLPILMFVPALLLLNADRTAGIASVWVKTPMLTGLGLSLLIFLGIAIGYFRAKGQNFNNKAAYDQQRDDATHNKFIDEIAAHKPDDPLVHILALTGRFHDADVREAAVAKVKSRPDWEAELIRLLRETSWDTEVYSFIDGNRVDHPELFVEPINISIRRVAEEVKNRIKDADNLQDWHFEHFGIERLFRAIDQQFLLPGADYRPAVLDLRKALDTPKPERFKDVKFTLAPIVDNWLKKHK
jgi:hypothetical protein